MSEYDTRNKVFSSSVSWYRRYLSTYIHSIIQSMYTYISAIKTLFEDDDEFHGSLSIGLRVCLFFLSQFTIINVSCRYLIDRYTSDYVFFRWNMYNLIMLLRSSCCCRLMAMMMNGKIIVEIFTDSSLRMMWIFDLILAIIWVFWWISNCLKMESEAEILLQWCEKWSKIRIKNVC